MTSIRPTRRILLHAATIALAAWSMTAQATVPAPAASPVPATVAAPAAAPAPAPVAAPAAGAPRAAPAVPKPALWVVRDEDTTIYLFGTIHVMRPDVQWFHPRIREALYASDELITEIPLEEFRDAQALLIQRAYTDDGLPLSEHLDAEQLSLYRRAMGRLRIPVAAFEVTEPWVPTFVLMSGPPAGGRYRADIGVEMVLARAARDRRMATSGLESLDMQFGFFDNLSMETQVAMLMDLSRAIVEPCTCTGRRGGLDTLVNTWAAGDVAGLAAANDADMAEEPAEFHQVLLPDRNDRWSQWIQLRLSEPGGKFFVAVGAAHLAGNESVQSFLAQAGITAERIEY